MKVGIIGGGFTGLTAAYELLKKGYEVVVFEGQSEYGGLSSSYEIFPGVFLERFYHHLFTNDSQILGLCKELNLEKGLNVLPSKTAVYWGGQLYPFDGVSAILQFSPLSLLNRLRLGIVSLLLKLFLSPDSLRNQTAYSWINKWYGPQVSHVVWEPLLSGKFSRYFGQVSAVWFWARIKKRTLKLVYPSGGFQTLIDALVAAIKQKGGKMEGHVQVQEIKTNEDGRWGVKFLRGEYPLLEESFDKIIVTTSLKTFNKMFPDTSAEYREKLDSVNYINAQVLVLSLKKSLTDYYWVNINDKEFPFLALVEQNNLINFPMYGGHRLVYLGNYLLDGDPRLSMNEDELLNLYEPFLKKLNPDFERAWVEKTVSFKAPFAQPVVDLSYPSKIPPFEVPGKANLYLATMAQVYPWDRGTNYAVKLAQDLVAEHF